MEELEQFKKRIQSIITRAYEGGVILLPFLDDALSAVLLDEMEIKLPEVKSGYY